MEPLNSLYAQLLQVGFIVLRQAVWSSNVEWPRMEVQFLHNIPSLLNESNWERHKHFWLQERSMYLEWANRVGGEPQSRMLTYYAPILHDMEPIMQTMLATVPPTAAAAVRLTESGSPPELAHRS